MQTVKSSDVLDVTHYTSRAFRAQVIGAFRRVGPNAWDDYRYVSENGPELDVYPDVGVQLEPQGAEIRSRSGGRVVRLRWKPEPAELSALRANPDVDDTDVDDTDVDDTDTGDAGDTPQARRRWFITHCLSERGPEALLGAGAVMAAKLSSD
ncbi:MAG TPA: hypothetical protein VIV60_19705 [Polyangiaceae bacterium]